MTAYVDRPSPLDRLDPRIKIAWSMAVSLLAVMLGHPILLAALLALSLVPWCLVRPPWRQVRWLLWASVVTAVGTTLSQGFFYGLQPRTELLTLLPGLSLCREGLLHGGVVSLRLLAVLAAGTSIVLTTHPSDLILAMTRLRVPHWFAFMLTLALRFLPETVEQARRILVAQQLRGVGGRGLRASARRFRFLVVPLIVNLLRSARQVALAAETRACSADRVPSRELRFSPLDWAVALGLLLLVAGGVAASVLGYGAAPGGVL